MKLQLEKAYLVWTNQCRRPADCNFNWKVPHHRCTGECDFFHVKDVLICKATGFWHYCTSTTCDRMVITPEHQYCELSGQTFELDFVFGAPGRGFAQGARGGYGPGQRQ